MIKESIGSPIYTAVSNAIDIKTHYNTRTNERLQPNKSRLFLALLKQTGAQKLRATAILFFAALFFPSTSWSFNFMSFGYTVEFEESYGKGHSPIVASVISTADGGYAFAGSWGGTAAAWMVKADGKGKQQWEQAFQTNRTTSLQRASVTLPTRDGGYLMGGQTDALDLVGSQWDDIARPSEMKGRPKTALVAKLNNDGQVVWKKIFGPLEKFNWNEIHRGITVPDGYIFLGSKRFVVTNQPTPTGTVHISSLWLFKINDVGELLWEKAFPQDDGEYLLPSASLEHYSKLLVDNHGNIVFATAIEELLSEDKDGKRILTLRGTAPSQRKKVMLIKLDKLGNELVRARLPFGVAPTLIARDDGYHLLNNQPVEGRVGFRSIRLDAKLNIISERVIPARDFWIRYAVPGPNGGLHLAGYHRTPPNERGEAAVAYL